MVAPPYVRKRDSVRLPTRACLAIRRGRGAFHLASRYPADTKGQHYGNSALTHMITDYGFRVFLGGLPSWVSVDDIRHWLKADGFREPNFIKVVTHRETGLSAGFCFIYAKTETDGRAIIERYDGAPLEDKLLRCGVGRINRGKENG